MRYPVMLQKTEEGYSVHCPGLPGCWSQGETEEQAMENIKSAIQEWLEVAEEIGQQEQRRWVDVAI